MSTYAYLLLRTVIITGLGLALLAYLLSDNA